MFLIFNFFVPSFWASIGVAQGSLLGERGSGTFCRSRSSTLTTVPSLWLQLALMVDWLPLGLCALPSGLFTDITT